MSKALLVGINAYPGCPLNGCVNDVDDMSKCLKIIRNIRASDIVVLKDKMATTENILHELNSFVAQMTPGKSYLFHYSGHGAQVSGNEADGKNECICPVDFDWSDKHMIKDDQFFEIFSKVPDGAVLYWVSDSCHSGDLERSMESTNRLYPLNKAPFTPVKKNWFQKLFCRQKSINYLKNVVMLSGSRDDQTSADACFKGVYNGALTYFLLKALRNSVPFIDVYNNLRKSLKKAGFSQQPELTGNVNLVNKNFMFN
jgi:metacaspase-1